MEFKICSMIRNAFILIYYYNVCFLFVDEIFKTIMEERNDVAVEQTL